MAASNVVEILVTSKNEATPGMTEAAASAREVTAATKELSAAEQAEADAKAAVEEKAAALAGVQEREAATAKEVADAEAAVAGAQEKAAAASDTAAAASDRVSIAQARQADAAKTVADAQAAAAAKVSAAAAESAGAQTAAGDAAVASGAKSDTAGGLMAGMGAKVKMAGLGVAVGMGLAVKAGMDFQQNTTKWVTSAGESASQLGALQQGVLALSAQTATSSTELSNGLYMVSSAGITGAGGLGVLQAAAQGAKSEGADLTEVTNALTSGLNAYGMKTKTAAEATASSNSMMNQMLATVSAGKMTFQELAGSLSAVLPVAAANKISYAEVGGALSTMTSMGVSAQQGTQNLANVIRNLSNVQGPARAEMSQFGISASDVQQNLGQRGLTGTIQMLSKAVTDKMGPSGTVIVNAMNQSKSAAQDAQEMLGKLPASIQGVAKSYLNGSISSKTWTNDLKAMPPLQANLAKEWANVANQSHSFNDLLKSGSPVAQTYSAALGKMLGGATGLSVGLMLTGSHAQTFAGNVKSISAAAADTSKVSGFNDVTKTTAFQMAKAGDSIKATGTELGLALLPAVNSVLAPLASFLSMIAQNKAAALAFAIVIGSVLAGAIGTKAVHAVTDFKKAVETTVEGVGKLVGKIAGLGSAQEKAAEVTKKAQAESAAATEEAAVKEEAASGEAAAAQEGDAVAVAAANDEAAAESSGSWVASAGASVAAGAKWAGQAVLSAGKAAAGYAVAAAQAVAAWAVAGAGMVAQAAKWVATSVAKVAVVVASNVAGALTTAAAWVAANAVMLAGIVLVVAAVAIAVYEIVTHWKSIVHGVEETWNAVYHAVSVAVSAVVDFVKAHWELLVAILLGPIAVATLEIAKHWDTIKSDVSKFAHDVTSTISKLASDVLQFFEKMWNDVTGAVSHGISVVIGDVTRWFSDFLHIEESGLDNIVHFFEGLPGRIVAALGDVGSLLLSSGENIVRGLVNGIESMGSFLANAILSLIPSPIRGLVEGALGILSPSKVFHGYGQNIVQGLVNGVAEGSPKVQQTMRQFTGQITQGMGSGDPQQAMRQLAAKLTGTARLSASSPGAALAIAGVGPDGKLRVQLGFDGGDDAIIQGIRKAIRVRGGNTQKVLGAT